MKDKPISLLDHQLVPDSFWWDVETIDGLRCELCERVFRDETDVEWFGQCDVFTREELDEMELTEYGKGRKDAFTDVRDRTNWPQHRNQAEEQLDRIREMLGLQGSEEDVPEALGKYLIHLERLAGGIHNDQRGAE